MSLAVLNWDIVSKFASKPVKNHFWRNGLGAKAHFLETMANNVSDLGNHTGCQGGGCNDSTYNGSAYARGNALLGNQSQPGGAFGYEYAYGDYSYYYDEDYIARYFRQPPQLLAMILGVSSMLLNALSLMALSQVRMRFTAHFRLIISLAISDILVGVSVMVHIINNVLNPVYDWTNGTYAQRIQYRCAFTVIKALNTTSLNISLLNLLGMAIDHYMAIIKPLHYPALMSKQRTNIFIISLWVIAIVCGFSDFFSALHDFHRYIHIYNYCEMIWLSRYQEEYIVFAIALIGVFIMLYIYIKIYLKVKRRRKNMPGEQFDNPRHCVYKNESKWNRRALVTTLLILGTFMVCWLPICLFQVVLVIQSQVNPKALYDNEMALITADSYLYDLLLINAICDPVIYTVRMSEVQLGYRRLFLQCARLFGRRDSRSSENLYGTASANGGIGGSGIRRSRLSAGGLSLKSQPSMKSRCSVNTPMMQTVPANRNSHPAGDVIVDVPIKVHAKIQQQENFL